MLGKKLFRLRNCHRGIALVEFAIIAPVLLLILIGFIELALIFFTQSIIEGATGMGSRIGKTGYAGQGGSSREEYIKSEIRRLSHGYLKMENMKIEILSYNSFDDIGKPEPCTNDKDFPPCPLGFIDVNGDGKWSSDQGISDNAGGRRSVVVYRVTYPWDVMTPIMRSIIGNEKGQLNITAVATVRNERFE